MARFGAITRLSGIPAASAQPRVAPRGLMIYADMSTPAFRSNSSVTTLSLPPPMGTMKPERLFVRGVSSDCSGAFIVMKLSKPGVIPLR